MAIPLATVCCPFLPRHTVKLGVGHGGFLQEISRRAHAKLIQAFLGDRAWTIPLILLIIINWRRRGFLNLHHYPLLYHYRSLREKPSKWVKSHDHTRGVPPIIWLIIPATAVPTTAIVIVPMMVMMLVPPPPIAITMIVSAVIISIPLPKPPRTPFSVRESIANEPEQEQDKRNQTQNFFHTTSC